MRFAADAMLGRLATRLRLLGYDTFYQADIEDRTLAKLAADEGRTILTRDVGLTQRRGVSSLLIASDDVWSQLQQVVAHFGLRPDRDALGGRCPRCNQSLALLPKAAAAGRVPAYVWESQDDYRECQHCHRVFWRGSHAQRWRAACGRSWRKRMKIAIGSDERSHLTDFLVDEIRRRGHDVLLYGPLAEDDPEVDWPLVSAHVAEAVAGGEADEGIVCCWTGTGASIAANKVPGVRAALVHDVETTRGARVYNHANVLALSLRATSEPIAKEILDTWFATPTDAGDAQQEWNRQQIERIHQLEAQYGHADA